MAGLCWQCLAFKLVAFLDILRLILDSVSRLGTQTTLVQIISSLVLC